VGDGFVARNGHLSADRQARAYATTEMKHARFIYS
jgi:hypothetical protein